MREPTVVVFDSRWSDSLESPTHEQIIGDILGNRAHVVAFSFFTRIALDQGEVGEFIQPEDIAKMEPTIAIVELDVMDNGFNDGARLVRNLIKVSPLDLVPTFVVSDLEYKPKMRRRLERLGVDGMLTWSTLLDEGSEERASFVEAVEAILAAEVVSGERPRS